MQATAQPKEPLMSTYYAPFNKIRAGDLFDGRLEKFGVREHMTTDSTETSKCLTDGRNYLWVFVNDAGFVANINRYGGNAPSKILNAIAEVFDTDIFSEYEPQYWGFDTEEEWHSAWDAEARQAEQRFYDEVVKYVRGEANDVPIGRIGETEAKIAKVLAASDPSLLLPENRSKLIHNVKKIYDRDHSVTVTLTPEDLAFVEMIATHEDDLPKA